MVDRSRRLVVDERAAAGLGRGEAVVIDEWLGAARARALRLEVVALVDAQRFRPAGIGAASGRIVAPTVRGDRICWFDPDGVEGVRPGVEVALFLARLDLLVQHLNGTCYLALRRVECQASCFEPGGFYAAHRDTFNGEASRVVSYCYYLNDAWMAGEGGCLRLHGAAAVDVAPLLDRLVVFRSADLLHEVLPTAVRRLALSGWMSRARRC